MGRFFGRRPDPTPAISKALRNTLLEPGETVLAGIYLQRPGTLSAGIEGGTSAGVSAAVGVHGARLGRNDDTASARWSADVATLPGVDASVAKRTIFLSVALTQSRVLLVRRSSMFRRHTREVFASWPLTEVDRIEMPPGSSTLRIVTHHGQLPFELPQALKFLDARYAELPTLLKQAQTDARASGG